MSENIIFEEKQKFKQFWIKILVLFVGIIVISTFGWGFIKQIILKQTWGSKPMPDSALILFFCFSFILGIGLPLLIFKANLKTKVTENGLSIKFFPFHLKFKPIPLKDIKNIQALEYHPIKEYGGWGIRGFKKKRAYNVSGNKGVLIEYEERTLLIGSQKAEELEKVLKTIKI